METSGPFYTSVPRHDTWGFFEPQGQSTARSIRALIQVFTALKALGLVPIPAGWYSTAVGMSSYDTIVVTK